MLLARYLLSWSLSEISSTASIEASSSLRKWGAFLATGGSFGAWACPTGACLGSCGGAILRSVSLRLLVALGASWTFGAAATDSGAASTFLPVACISASRKLLVPSSGGRSGCSTRRGACGRGLETCDVVGAGRLANCSPRIFGLSSPRGGGTADAEDE